LEQAVAENKAEFDSLLQHASYIEDKAVLLLGDEGIAFKKANLQCTVTTKNTLKKSMQAILEPAVHEVEGSWKPLAISEDNGDINNKEMKSALVKMNATNQVIFQVKA